MFHLRLAAVWIAAAVLCFGVGTADAIDYVYDFDSGRVNGAASPGIDLPGQDGWYEYNEGYEWQAKVRNDLAGYAGVDGLAACAPMEPGPPTYTGAASRMNDENFGYSIPAATEFSIEFNALITNSGCWTLFGLAHDVSGNGHVATGDSGPHGETSFRFGYTQINGGHWGIRKANGGDWVTSTDAPSLYDAVWRIVLDVDPAVNDGDGAGSMSVQRLSGENPDTVLTPVASMQDVSLGLSGYVGGGPEEWDAIFIDFARGSAMDNLKITAVPEPGTGLLLLLGLAGFGLFLRRR